MNVCSRSFSGPLMAGIRTGRKLMTAKEPYQSHLTSATAQFRSIERPKIEDQVQPDFENDKKSIVKTSGGRIRREPVTPPESKSIPVDRSQGRLIRQTKTNTSGGSVAAAMSATAQFRQNRLMKENSTMSNPSTVSIPISKEELSSAASSTSTSLKSDSTIKAKEYKPIPRGEEPKEAALEDANNKDEKSNGGSGIGTFAMLTIASGGGAAFGYSYPEIPALIIEYAKSLL